MVARGGLEWAPGLLQEADFHQSFAWGEQDVGGRVSGWEVWPCLVGASLDPGDFGGCGGWIGFTVERGLSNPARGQGYPGEPGAWAGTARGAGQ